MEEQINLADIHSQIQVIKDAVRRLQKLSEDFPALNRNTARMSASLKMLELNVSDILELEGRQTGSQA